MTTLYRQTRIALLVAFAFVGSSNALATRTWAQDVFSDGGDPFAADADSDAGADDTSSTADTTADSADDPSVLADPTADPMADITTDRTADTAASTDEQAITRAPSSLGDAIATLNPQTPAQLFRAVDQLLRAERTDLARGYLNKLVGAKLTDTDLAELHQRFGSAAMLRLARNAELAPEGAAFAKQVLTAATAVAHDPARLEQWVEQLSSEQRRTQVLAARNLLRASGRAVEPIVRQMAAAPGSRGAQVGVEVLRHLGEEAIEPLLALQDSDDAALRTAAVVGLSQLNVPRVKLYLIAPLLAPRDTADESNAAAQAWSRLATDVSLPDHRAGAAVLQDAAARAYAGNVAGTPDADNQMPRWVWDAKLSHAVPVSMPIADAAAQEAARLYAALARLQPGDATARDRATIARLQVDQLATGLDMPLSPATVAPLAHLDELTLSTLLHISMQDGYESAAIALLQLLGATPSSSLVFQRGLQGDGNQPAPLVQALTHPNRRLRFAAAAALHQINPPASFDGASRLAETLGYFATATGQPYVLVAHPNISYAGKLAGIFSGHGYKTRAVDNERDLLEQAAASPDIEFVLISDAMNRWSVWSLIEMLRANPKTARLPVVVLGRRDRMAEVEQLAGEHARVMAWVENLTVEDLSSLVPRVTALAGRDAISADRRLEQGEAALKWLNQRMASDRTDGTPIVRQQDRLMAALNHAALAPDAILALAEIGSPESQSALLNTASENARPLAVRQAAAQAFQRSCAAFGRLLTREQIALQYERYNQSQYLDSSTQELLGGILDTLENPRPKDR